MHLLVRFHAICLACSAAEYALVRLPLHQFDCTNYATESLAELSLHTCRGGSLFQKATQASSQFLLIPLRHINLRKSRLLSYKFRMLITDFYAIQKVK